MATTMDIIIVHQETLPTPHRQPFIVELDGVITIVAVTIMITITGRRITRCISIQETMAAAVAAIAATRALPIQVFVAMMGAFMDVVILEAFILP